MKVLLSFFSILLFSATISGQDALLTGNRILGGGISFSQSDTDDTHLFANSLNPNATRVQENFSYSLSPYYGRMYKDFHMVGIRLNVGGFNAENRIEDTSFQDFTEVTRRSFGFGGFLRRYITYSDRFGVFIESGLDFEFRDEDTESISVNLTDPQSPIVNNSQLGFESLGGSLDFEIGLYFFVLNQLSIETRLSRFSLTYSDFKRTRRNLDVDEFTEGEGNNTSINFNFINNFSFDQIFTINYYF